MIARKTSLKKSKFTLKRKPSCVKFATGVKVKKKKTTKADLLRAWFLPENFQWSQLRYKHPYEKGVYWYYFSLEIRQRDVQNHGTCISCGKSITVDTCDAGHYIAAAGCGRNLLFDPLNVNAECGRCNGFDQNHLFGYKRGLIARYGKEAPSLLEDKYFLYKNSTEPVKDWSAKEYAEKIKLLSSFQQVASQKQKSDV